MEIYERLKDLREDKDLKQENIATVLGMKQQQYSNYERGARPFPAEIIKKLCIFYNISADYIFGFTNEPKPLPKK